MAPAVFVAGAGSKTIVLGLFERNGWVSTKIVPDVKKATLQKVVRGKVALDGIIHSDGWRGYHGLVNVGCAKPRLAKMKGICKNMFYLHLKETEFRFNHRRDDLYKLMIKILREQPI